MDVSSEHSIITFLSGVSRPIAVDQCSQIIYLIYLMLTSLFSFVVFNVSVRVYFITYRLQFVIYTLLTDNLAFITISGCQLPLLISV